MCKIRSANYIKMSLKFTHKQWQRFLEITYTSLDNKSFHRRSKTNILNIPPWMSKHSHILPVLEHLKPGWKTTGDVLAIKNWIREIVNFVLLAIMRWGILKTKQLLLIQFKQIECYYPNRLYIHHLVCGSSEVRHSATRLTS